jgi:uncharacterized phiE125 gp8 family phage protein
MTLVCTSVDRETLPDALLDLAKSHARVSHTRDDALITQYVAQAIDQVERRCSINLNPASYTVVLDVLAPCAVLPTGPVRVRLPVNNVGEFLVLDADASDVSAGYTVEQADLGGALPAYLVGAAPTVPGWQLQAQVGVEAPEDLSPAITAAVLRLAAAYYENREASVALTMDEFAPELVAIWNPSA